MRIQLFSWIFLIPLFRILLGYENILVSGQCLKYERSLLLNFKNSLNSTASSKLLQWDSTADCCNWRGVTCDVITGHVIGLDVNNESISGVLESSSGLFGLLFLQRLNLAFNSFSSMQIPPGLFNLTRLEYLNLSDSGFVGQIPSGFSRMTRLVVLDLSALYFPGSSSLILHNPNLTVLVQNLTELTELYLDGVNISAAGYEWCHAISYFLPNLRVLSLLNSYISGPIDPSLAKLQNLSVIRLGKNNMSTSVPDFFANFTNLTALQLTSCNLAGTFPERILKMPTLQTLDLSNNKLLHGSLRELPKNGSLRTLVLSQTKFSGWLPDSIGNQRNLSRIELTRCNFSGEISNSMAALTQLVYLDLSFNNFSGHVPSFQNSKNLTYLDISRNKLIGEVPPDHFQGLANLVYLDMRFNAFNGSIPSTLFALPSLQKLQLSHNKFNGSLAYFTNALSSQLDTLDISSNALDGSIPVSLFDLKSLGILSLSSNKFSGKIQLETLQGLGKLTNLDLSYNNLVIEPKYNSSSTILFPLISRLKLASCKLRNFPNLSHHPSLIYLDLSDNQIRGDIPKWIWNIGNGVIEYLNLSSNQLVKLEEPYLIPNVGILDLHSNKITGKIPEPPPTATYVDYSTNFFSSSLPSNIGSNLAFAYFFSVSKNRLNGTIPASICRASYLQVLDLSNNTITGNIPSCLFVFSKTLGVLNLGNNRLTGNISRIFQTNCSLQTLDLHGNLLSGKVPESLANCENLEVLNFGNNRISDKFPCFLENSSSLQVLVLRSNMFHGGIKCRDGHNIWEKLQIIDIASNNFTGSLSGNFFSWKAMKNDINNFTRLSFDFLRLNAFHYQVAVTLTIKGLELELLKTLTLFTSVDISNNHFVGAIPQTIGELKSLVALNLSHNTFTGPIPSSIHNLKQLESLDLSVNKLTGKIPEELSHLSFLAFLNLSNNQLTGRIPKGTQLQSFSETSFEGNKGLCGNPLPINCSQDPTIPMSSPTSQKEASNSDFDWQFIFTGLGFGVGASVILGTLMLLKYERHWWDECIDELLHMILPKLGINYGGHDQETVKLEDDNEEEPSDSEEYSHETETGGMYCVHCSKIDMFRMTVVHDPKCHCHSSTPIYSISSISSFSSSFP